MCDGLASLDLRYAPLICDTPLGILCAGSPWSAAGGAGLRYRLRHRRPARTPSGKASSLNSRVSCQCTRPVIDRPLRPAQATPSADCGPHRLRPASGTWNCSRHRPARPRSSGTSDAVPPPGDVRCGRARPPYPWACRPPWHVVARPTARANALPTVHRDPEPEVEHDTGPQPQGLQRD